jgi:membrane protease YdiL (CAAX protease family)
MVAPPADSAQTTPAILPLKFFAIAYGFSWCVWLLPLASARGWISWPWVSLAQIPILAVGAFGPLFASFLLVYRDGGMREVARFGTRALRWRIPIGHLCVALFVCPVIAAGATYLYSLQGGPALAWTMPLASLPLLFLLLFFIGGSLQEEFGWAYAIDRMQRKWSTLSASILMGVIWACWHLPLFFIPSMSQSYMPFWSFLVFCISLRVMFVWVYNASKQSILATLLFHTSTNLALNLFPLLRHDKDLVQYQWIYYTLLLAAAAMPIAWLARTRAYEYSRVDHRK